jgi:hypothetical protein
MKQALQSLIDEMEYVLSCINEEKIPFDGDDFHEALRLGKEALAKQEQGEPVAWAGYNLDDMCEAFDRVIEEHHYRKNPFHDPVNKDAMLALRILRGFVPYMKRYTTPQQRTWVGLTDRDIEAIWGEDVSLMYSGHYDAVRAIEAKLKEKNT